MIINVLDIPYTINSKTKINLDIFRLLNENTCNYRRLDSYTIPIVYTHHDPMDTTLITQFLDVSIVQLNTHRDPMGTSAWL